MGRINYRKMLDARLETIQALAAERDTPLTLSRSFWLSEIALAEESDSVFLVAKHNDTGARINIGAGKTVKECWLEAGMIIATIYAERRAV